MYQTGENAGRILKLRMVLMGQYLTRCETPASMLKGHFHGSAHAGFLYVPFESQWLILCPIQPTASKACSLQTNHQIGHFADGVPDDPGLVIRDHAENRPLIVAEIIIVNPA